MAPLPGLTGLNQIALPVDTQAILEQQGVIADPSHGGPPYTGQSPQFAPPYPSSGQAAYGPSGLESPLGSYVLPPGDHQIDATPVTHAGPWPKGVGDGDPKGPENWEYQQVMADIHSQDLGAVRANTQLPGVDKGSYDNTYIESEGSALLEAVPGQIKGAGAGKDVIQGYGKNDDYGYGGMHVLHRTQKDSVPYNFQWLDPSERPFIVNNISGIQPTFNGPDSPYAEQGDTTQGMGQSAQGAAVLTDPTPYEAPSSPGYDPSSPDAAITGNTDSWAWLWLTPSNFLDSVR